MAESALLSVGRTIGNLLIDEAKFSRGVEGKVEDLQRELKRIQCLLRDADARREHDQVVQEWVALLRDIAYDAVDVVEQYILRVAPNKGQNIIKAFACFMEECTCMRAHVVGTEIEGLKSRISNLRDMMEMYGIQPLAEDERKRARASMAKHTYAHLKEEDLVGREDSIQLLVKALLKDVDGEQHRVISICGMGGLGKTTLAKKIFAHDNVKNHFDGFAWACISQEYVVRDILETILVKLIPDCKEGVTTMREYELLETLYMTQTQKRCIVVLDDIWTKQAWDGLRAAFPIKDMKSKLLITTRNKELAEYIDASCFAYEPKCLTNKESWELLMKRAFPERKTVELSSIQSGVGQGIAAAQAVEGFTRQAEMEGQKPVLTENMESLGNELLKKCGGLPLAIIVLGGLLAVNEWKTVYRQINLHFSDKSDVSKVLALSYDDLPWYLKPCFLYLGHFPEDVEIPVTEVLHMWIAEGLVLPNTYDEERIIVEDLAKQYLMELVNRGMVQVQLNLSGNVKTCRLHSLIGDLCIAKARQERFLNILSIQQDDEMEDCSSVPLYVESTFKTRRLSLNMSGRVGRNMILRVVEQISRTMLHLRTLMFFNSGEFVKEMEEQFNPIFSSCKFLRVLKLEDLSWMRKKLPESVGELIHLRYLSLARSSFKGLPQSMGNLVCMEFLNLHVGPYVRVTVPNVMWKMRRLRCLHLPLIFSIDEKFHGDHNKLRLASLKNLLTLKNFSMKNCDVNDVGKLTHLRKLTVCDQNGSFELEMIPQLAKFSLNDLQSASFRFSRGVQSFTEDELSKMSSFHQSCKLSIWGEIEKLPEYSNLPERLRKLVLRYSFLEEDPMPILEKLHHLVVLLLGNWAFVGKQMVCSAGGFPQLKYLAIDCLPNVEEWRVTEGAMPHLSRLAIRECPKLKEVPQGVYIYHGSEDIDEEYRKHPDVWR